MIDLWIPGRPKPAERPRMTRRGRAYTPAATLEAEDRIATAFTTAYGYYPVGGAMFPNQPLALVVDYANHGERIQFIPLDGAMPPMRGDTDNYLKTTMDGLQKGRAFANDKQIVEVWARKWGNDADIEHMARTVFP